MQSHETPDLCMPNGMNPTVYPPPRPPRPRPRALFSDSSTTTVLYESSARQRAPIHSHIQTFFLHSQRCYLPTVHATTCTCAGSTCVQLEPQNAPRSRTTQSTHYKLDAHEGYINLTHAGHTPLILPTQRSRTRHRHINVGPTRG